MGGLNPVLIGVTLALAGSTILTAKMLTVAARAIFAYSVLVLMVGIYLGFAAIAVDQATYLARPIVTIVMMEALTALILTFIGLGVVQSDKPWILGVLIMVHGGVDLAHMLLGTTYSPTWYELMCVIYDGIVGVAFVIMLGERPEKISDPTPSL